MILIRQNYSKNQIHIEKFDHENEIEIKIEDYNTNLNIWLSAGQVKELSDFLLEELKRIKNV